MSKLKRAQKLVGKTIELEKSPFGDPFEFEIDSIEFVEYEDLFFAGCVPKNDITKKILVFSGKYKNLRTGEVMETNYLGKPIYLKVSGRRKYKIKN